MLEQLINNWICWVILALALFCYQQIWLQWFCRHSHVTSAGIQKEFSAILINTLPLLGLFGTIVGLLDCFSVLAQSGVKGELVSQGIADALITTQLGLVCAIPAWLMHYWLLPTSRDNKQQIIAEQE